MKTSSRDDQQDSQRAGDDVGSFCLQFPLKEFSLSTAVGVPKNLQVLVAFLLTFRNPASGWQAIGAVDSPSLSFSRLLGILPTSISSRTNLADWSHFEFGLRRRAVVTQASAVQQSSDALKDKGKFSWGSIASRAGYVFDVDDFEDETLQYKFTPDSKHMLFLNHSQKTLYATNVATGKTWPVGLTSAVFVKKSQKMKKLKKKKKKINAAVRAFEVAGTKGTQGRILISMGSRRRPSLYVREGINEDSPLYCVYDSKAAPLGPGSVLDPHISEDGHFVYFWFRELYCVPSDGSAPPRALTTGARGVTRGLSTQIRNCECGWNNGRGYWISPDASKIAYLAVEYRAQPFLSVGQAIPKFELFVISTAVVDASHSVPVPVKLDLTGPSGEEDFYLSSVAWLSDRELAVQVLSRDQEHYRLLRCVPDTGHVESVVYEHCLAWVNLHSILKPIGGSGKLLWASERTGFCHLYVHEPTNPNVMPLTKGNWMVEEVVAVNEESGHVYFMGYSEGNWLERHLFKVPESPSTIKPEQISVTPGVHHAIVDKSCTIFVDIVSSAVQPPVVTLRNLTDGCELHSISDDEDTFLKNIGSWWTAPEFVTFPSADGKVTLQGALYKPDPKEHGAGPYPTVVSCYGSPHAQTIQHSWKMNEDPRAQSFRNRGFLVLKVDNRGTFRRGLEFQAPVKHRLGSIEVDDQVAGVNYCIEQGLANAQKVGIYGESHGGYLSLMCLAKAGHVFKCAVAGAPITTWEEYDNLCFVERYMGTPQSNPVGFASSSVMAHIERISGDLLLAHNRGDDNVNFSHTARLMSALKAMHKPYQVLAIERDGHFLNDPALEEQIAIFFHRCLQGD